jgi:hypothetical protein
MTEQNQTPDVTTEEDTEGHFIRSDGDGDDVEGHGFKHRDDSDDDVEGHGFKHRDDSDDEDDVEGHGRHF